MKYQYIYFPIKLLYKNFGSVEPPVHSCQLCRLNFGWESISLKPHIEKKHNISIQEYFEKFMESYEENSDIVYAIGETQERDQNTNTKWTLSL